MRRIKRRGSKKKENEKSKSVRGGVGRVQAVSQQPIIAEILHYRM